MDPRFDPGIRPEAEKKITLISMAEVVVVVPEEREFKMWYLSCRGCFLGCGRER